MKNPKNSKHPVLDEFDKLTVSQWLGIICSVLSVWLILTLLIILAKTIG